MTKSATDRIGEGSVSRRTVLAAAAWSAPVIAVAVGTPLAAASGPAALLGFTVNRNGDDGSFRDYRVDFALSGPLPEIVTIEWIPATTTDWGLFDQSVNIVHLSGDFTSGATYRLDTAMPNFWFQTQTPLVTDLTPYVVRVIDPASSAVLASVTVTFTGDEPVPN